MPPTHPSSPALEALLRAELERLGLAPDEVAAELAALWPPPAPQSWGELEPPSESVEVDPSVLTAKAVDARTLQAAGAQGGLTASVPQPGGTTGGPPRRLRWGKQTLALGERTLVMGVINVTDDSLSGDGLGHDLGAVLAQAVAFVAAGADILDVGGESTRPGAATVDPTEERARVEPAIARLASRLTLPISVDTRKAAVAEAALAAGAGAINDVTGLRHDRAVAAVAARAGAALILGHWAPSSPQNWGAGGGGPRAGGATAAVLRGLQESVAWAVTAGCAADQLAVDPGLGFGKAPRVSLALLRDLASLRALGLPLVVGPSRKGFLGHVLGREAQFGWEGTAAAVALAIAGSADIVRVHDVARLSRVVRMSDAIVRAQSAECRVPSDK